MQCPDFTETLGEGDDVTGRGKKKMSRVKGDEDNVNGRGVCGEIT